MRKLFLTLCLLIPVGALAQEPAAIKNTADDKTKPTVEKKSPPILIIPAADAKPLSVLELARENARLTLENAQLRLQAADNALNQNLQATLARLNLKPEEGVSYDRQVMEDGSWVYRKKEAAPAQKQ